MIVVRIWKEFRVDNGVALAGFPGMGLVGKTVVDYLIEKLNAEHVGSIYSTRFPAHLIIRGSALGDVHRVDIYLARVGSLSLVLVTGDTQPYRDEDQNELSFKIAEELVKRGVKEVITAAAFVTETVVENRRVFAVGTSENVVKKYIESGATPLDDGVVTGMNGVLIGWSRILGVDGVCLLGETWRSIVELNYIDYGASKVVLQLLSRVWSINIDLSDIEVKAREVEAEVRRMVQRFGKTGEEVIERRRESTYIT